MTHTAAPPPWVRQLAKQVAEGLVEALDRRDERTRRRAAVHRRKLAARRRQDAEDYAAFARGWRRASEPPASSTGDFVASSFSGRPEPGRAQPGREEPDELGELTHDERAVVNELAQHGPDALLAARRAVGEFRVLRGALHSGRGGRRTLRRYVAASPAIHDAIGVTEALSFGRRG